MVCKYTNYDIIIQNTFINAIIWYIYKLNNCFENDIIPFGIIRKWVFNIQGKFWKYNVEAS